MIRSVDYEVKTATMGADALARISTETDVVLLDRRMPDRSGDGILSAIRSRGLDCQIVSCSAVVPDVDIIPLETDAYLQKPIGPEEFSGAIERQYRIGTRGDTVREYAALEAKQTAIEEGRSPADDDRQYQVLLKELEQKRQLIDNTEIEPISA